MPIWARLYFNGLVRGILLKGNDWANLWPSVWPVVLFMVVVIAIALRLPAHARLGDVARSIRRAGWHIRSSRRLQFKFYGTPRRNSERGSLMVEIDVRTELEDEY